ncbi:hypothetical protein NQ314_001092 [Rhamnusium bicolor]|uniref:DUF4806 domain-containing protein n=1 Tax=Rhamnusium bicolor TaxID=1586634 RepID=A0AAV8ZV76_9CUCU|nr:hypothetical protein NQ314_001092 [Rhamnusium bicolor]
MPKISRNRYRVAKIYSDLTLNRIKLDIDQVQSEETVMNASSSIEVNSSILSSTISSTSTSSIDLIPNLIIGENNSEPENISYETEYQNIVTVDDCNLNPNFDIVEDSFPNQSNKSLSYQLSEWALTHQITHVALNDLLKILKPHHDDLPVDARTLLKTPRKTDIEIVQPGHYYHFGLENCVQNLFCRYPPFKNLEYIQVCINIDGLPIAKSSSSQVYPILCSIFENLNFVDIVGIYHGNEKPKEANLFLRSFVEEAIKLTESGITVNSHKYPFQIKSFICDVPAKAFITITKGHSGYFSCSKCNIEGIYYNNRVCFPNLENLRLRTDFEFRSKLQEEHHLGTSILESIPNLDMINSFPLDPMHLLYLGVVKKLIVGLWCNGTPATKLSYKQISDISDTLVSRRKNMPSEFNRKPRPLSESKRWKATEFRQFLLYTGPIVLKSVLSPDRYINFLTLHIAVIILSNNKYQEKHLDYAHSLFCYFVKTFVILYGQENCSHNIHNLLHICNDSKNFGILSNFHAFPFENYMQDIKKNA